MRGQTYYAVIVVFTMFVVLGCAHKDLYVGLEIVPQQEYMLFTKYIPSRKLFEVELKSFSNKSICLTTEQWWGGVNGSLGIEPTERIFVEYDGKRYSRFYFPGGYCVGNGCVIEVRPSKSIRGVALLSEFDIPADVISSENFSPVLIHPIEPGYCEHDSDGTDS